MVRTGTAAALAVAALSAALGAAPAPATPLLPLGRGQLTVLLGETGQWQPRSGAPQTLTLIGGPPRSAGARALTAFVALQRASRPCAGSARTDGAALTSIPSFYGPGDLVAAGSPLAPLGGSAPGVHAASAEVAPLSERGAVRACVWLARRAGARSAPVTQLIPLLDGLFAAVVWPTPAPSRGFTLDAAAVGTAFGYTLTSNVCGAVRTGPRVGVTAGDEVAASVSVGSLDCPGDAWRFSFFGGAAAPFGTIDYSDAQALAAPAVYAHLGGCDLGGVAGLTPAAAGRYVAAVGCRAARVLRAPFDGAVARGRVSEAQVDGGEAPLAPAGTNVDLVLDG